MIYLHTQANSLIVIELCVSIIIISSSFYEWHYLLFVVDFKYGLTSFSILQGMHFYFTCNINCNVIILQHRKYVKILVTL